MMDDNQDSILSNEFIQNADSRELMEKIYNIHGDYLFRIIIHQLHVHPDDEEAHDCFSMIFLKLSENNCRRVRMFRGRSSFKTYFVTVCRNLIVDYFRENRNNALVDYMEPEKLGMNPSTFRNRLVTPENTLIEEERKEKFRLMLKEAFSEIEHLTDQEKLVINLKYSMKRTYDEINRMTGDKNSAYTLKCSLDKIRKAMGKDWENLFFTLIEE
jgi:RNA polymerase sigma factor (sigma-70 family)